MSEQQPVPGQQPAPRLLRLALLAVLLGAGAFWMATHDRSTGSGAPPPAPVAPEGGEAGADARLTGLAGSVAELRRSGEALAALDPGSLRDEAKKALITEARAVGDRANAEQRTDIHADIGRVLIEAGETGFAEAFLQRSIGILKPVLHGKDAMYPLAQLRRASGRPLEAASLYERAIDIEPTLPSEFVGLSDLYLAAGRMGPARAAVSRGLARHGDSIDLVVQGAKVGLLDGRAKEAVATLRSVLIDQPDHVGAQLVHVEALLATGSLDEAAREATGLREDFPEDPWGWIFGAVVLRATAQDDSSEGRIRTMTERARVLTGDCACTHEERLAIRWSEGIAPSAQVAPRRRTEVPDPVPAPPPPKAQPKTAKPPAAPGSPPATD